MWRYDSSVRHRLVLGHVSVRRPVVVPVTVPILNAHWQSTRKIISRVEKEKEKENTWSSGRSLMLAYFPFAFVLVVCQCVTIRVIDHSA